VSIQTQLLVTVVELIALLNLVGSVMGLLLKLVILYVGMAYELKMKNVIKSFSMQDVMLGVSL